MIVYHPLKGSQFRLLHISAIPSSRHRPTNIQWNLETFDLDKTSLPSFTALSYTWGPAHPNSATLCKANDESVIQSLSSDGHLDVAPNLRSFLHEYTSSRSEHFVAAYVWIDALCIHQADTAERSTQVQLMSRIYQVASRVIVWLGPGDRLGDHALDLLERIAEGSEEQRAALHPHFVKADHENMMLDLAHWEALIRFFQRSWFNRVWVIQEVVFATIATMWCGHRSIAFDTVGVVSGFLATSVWTDFMRSPLLAPNKTGLHCWHNTPTRMIASRTMWRSGHHDGFLHALIRARKSSAQDPRDKVYSQLGLGSANIIPKYTISVTEVYIETAVSLLQQPGGLLTLAFVEGVQHVPGLPSWVPDWSVTDYLGLGVTGYPQFHADGLTSQTSSVKRDGAKHILCLQGVCIDEIVRTCETKKGLLGNPTSLALWEMVSLLGPSHGSAGQPGDEVLWRTLMTDRGTAPPPKHIQFPASPKKLAPSFRAWLLWRYAIADKEPAPLPLLPWTTPVSSLPSAAEMIQARKLSQIDSLYSANLARDASLFHFSYSLAMNLRPFMTQAGYFSVGAQNAEAGDTVWIVPGCRVPLILRRVGDSHSRYRLIGGAYVHGIMENKKHGGEPGLGCTDIELE